VFLGEYSQCYSNKIGKSSTFLFFMCKFFEIPKYGENLSKFQNHNIERKKHYKQTLTFIIRSFTKKICCRNLCNIYFKYIIMYHLIQARFVFVDFILHQLGFLPLIITLKVQH